MLPDTSSRLPSLQRLRAGCPRNVTAMMAVLPLRACGFPNLSKRSFRAVDWIVVGNRKRRDLLIGLGSLAWLAPKQVPVASIRICANNGEVLAPANFLVSNTGRNHNHVPGVHVDILAVLATNSQSCGATKHPQHLVRRAVIMRERINAVSPRVAPVVFGKAFFKKGRGILPITWECVAIHQQRQHTVWKNTVVLKRQLFGL